MEPNTPKPCWGWACGGVGGGARRKEQARACIEMVGSYYASTDVAGRISLQTVSAIFHRQAKPSKADRPSSPVCLCTLMLCFGITVFFPGVVGSPVAPILRSHPGLAMKLLRYGMQYQVGVPGTWYFLQLASTRCLHALLTVSQDVNFQSVHLNHPKEMYCPEDAAICKVCQHMQTYAGMCKRH